MRNYWLTQEMLEFVGFGYVIFAAAAIVGALWLPKSKFVKAVLAIAVTALLSIEPYRAYQEAQEQKIALEIARRKVEAVRVLFQQRCRSTGEKIHRTADDVEAISIERLRPDRPNQNDQFALDDPYGHQFGGAGYVNIFLYGKDSVHGLTDRHRKGAYRYVDLVNPSGGAIRHEAIFSVDGVGVRRRLVTQTEVPTAAPYLFRWKDSSTRQDRENWIACGYIEIVDQRTGERMAEREGCMVDLGLGNQTGGRSPWTYARDVSCPPPRRTESGGRAIRDPIDREFAEKVLRPKEMNQ